MKLPQSDKEISRHHHTKWSYIESVPKVGDEVGTFTIATSLQHGTGGLIPSVKERLTVSRSSRCGSVVNEPD